MPTRVLTLLAIGFVLAWLAIGLRAEMFADRGKQAAQRSAAEVEGSLRDLRRSAELTPDKDPTVTRARLLARTGRSGEAVRLLRGLVADQPDNALYWAALARIAPRTDPAAAARARARLRELVPPVPPR